jgi:hypothetical protein
MEIRMIIAVQGTNTFDDYQVFLRAMGVAMSMMPEGDNEFHIYTAGPVRINSMVSEFAGVSEKSFKSRGMKIKFFKVPASYIEENLDYVNYLAFFSKPKESTTRLVQEAESRNIEVGLFRY